jgi:uncharacterized damage-inducible protein DinB
VAASLRIHPFMLSRWRKQARDGQLRSTNRVAPKARDRRETRQPPEMPAIHDLAETILAAWRTNHRVTVFLVRHLPSALWTAQIPGAPRRTIRMLAAHLHNSRRMWLKTLGRPHGIPVPFAVDRRNVSRRQLIAALNKSSRGIEALLRLGLRSGGVVPASPAYVWRNLPLDVGHLLAYFVAHEGHHRGQIVLVARQIGSRLPATVTAGLWQFTKRSKE